MEVQIPPLLSHTDDANQHLSLQLVPVAKRTVHLPQSVPSSPELEVF